MLLDYCISHIITTLHVTPFVAFCASRANLITPTAMQKAMVMGRMRSQSWRPSCRWPIQIVCYVTGCAAELAAHAAHNGKELWKVKSELWPCNPVTLMKTLTVCHFTVRLIMLANALWINTQSRQNAQDNCISCRQSEPLFTVDMCRPSRANTEPKTLN